VESFGERKSNNKKEKRKNIIMENLCKTGECKRKLKEYRELTTKLYDDIDGLEGDIKDKDDFVQKIVKARNALQSEVAGWKKKNLVIIKENEELSTKNEQLDEDAETGLMMVRNAHERERKLKNEIEEYTKNEIESKKKKEELEKENTDFKTKFEFLKARFEKSLKANQESNTLREAQIKELEQKIVDAKEKSTSDHSNCFPKVESESKLKGQAELIETLQVENNSLKMKNSDLSDEITTKNRELQDFQEQSLLKSSGSSLSEELAQIGVFKCDKCNMDFTDDVHLKEHNSATHEVKLKKKLDLLANLSFLERKVSEQRLEIGSSLLELKHQELEKSHLCTCKTFCRIFHKKHNFICSKSDKLSLKLENISVSNSTLNNSNAEIFGAKRRQYTCNKCDQKFCRQGDLKKHKKTEHNSREV
jgi:hypothetical protein